MIERQGTHTDAVDVALQQYNEKFINTGTFKIQKSVAELESSGLDEKTIQILRDMGHVRDDPFSPFERVMRPKISSGSAITLTTNVSDVNMVSEDVFNYLLNTKEGRGRISISVDSETLSSHFGLPSVNEVSNPLAPHSPQNFEGTISYDARNGKYRLTGSGVNEGEIPQFQERAEELVSETLRGARGLDVDPTDIQMSNGKTISTNVHADRIHNISMSPMEATEIDQMLQAKAQDLSRVVSPETFQPTAKGLSLTSDIYEGGTIPVRSGQILDTGGTRSETYMQGVMDHALPYRTIDPRSRVAAEESARATSDIGKRILTDAARTDPRYKPVAQSTGDLSEFLQTFFMGQGKHVDFGTNPTGDTEKIADASYALLPIKDVPGEVNRSVVPYDVFRNLEVQRPIEGEMKTVKLGSQEFLTIPGSHKVTMSKVQLGTSSGDQSLINAIYHHQFPTDLKEAKAESESLAQQIMEAVIGKDAAKARRQPHAQLQASIESTLRENGYNKGLTLEHIKALVSQDEEKSKRLFGESYETAAEAYRGVIADFGSTLRNEDTSGFGIGFLSGPEAKLYEEIQTRHKPELMQSTDALSQDVVSQITEAHPLGFSVGPAYRETADDAAEQILRMSLGESAEAAEGAGAATRVLRHQEALNARQITAEAIASNTGKIADNIIVNNSPDPFEAIMMPTRQFYRENKKAFAIGAVAIGAALGARHLYKKHTQNELYESTIEEQEPEKFQRSYGAQHALLNAKPRSSSLDPLATAGIVGNMDRSKINHSNMSNSKNNHLFQG